MATTIMMAHPIPLKRPANAMILRGLVMWLPTDEKGGDTLYDRSRRGNIGARTGATWSLDGRLTCLDFDGSDDDITVADNDLLDVTTAFSLLMWIKPDNTDNTTIFAKGAKNIGSSEYYAYLGLILDSTVALYISNGSASQGIGGLGAISTTKWSHIALTVGTKITSYLNGQLKSSATRTITPSINANPLYIGRFYYSGWDFNGKMADIRLYNRTLTTSEVRQICEGTRPRQR